MHHIFERNSGVTEVGFFAVVLDISNWLSIDCVSGDERKNGFSSSGRLGCRADPTVSEMDSIKFHISIEAAEQEAVVESFIVKEKSVIE